jgi:type IV secretory pathway TrbF-like protein
MPAPMIRSPVSAASRSPSRCQRHPRLADSFRVAWTERHYENGQLSTTERWTAILTIVIQTPRDAERLRANPLGIYVNAISWSREMSQ